MPAPQVLITGQYNSLLRHFPTFLCPYTTNLVDIIPKALT